MDLRVETGAVARPWVVVRVAGPDAVAYLQGQLSQDVAALAPGETAWSLLLEPTGKTCAWLRVTRTDDDVVVLDAPGPDPEPVRARLARFLLRTEAEVEVLDWKAVAVRGPGSPVGAVPGAALVLDCGWPGAVGVDLLGPDPRPEGIAPADPGDLEALRIAAGVPLLGAEVTPETIPAELGAWLVERSVSFAKGCYTGQELVARIDSRGGQVPRPVRALVMVPAVVPPVGSVVARDAAVAGEGEQVGVVTSSAPSARWGAVALARLARAVEPGTEVEVRWSDG
ncbi:MAG: folate-binding protein YgfZ, partial [Acidimicrobiia bacterium]